MIPIKKATGKTDIFKPKKIRINDFFKFPYLIKLRPPTIIPNKILKKLSLNISPLIVRKFLGNIKDF